MNSTGDGLVRGDASPVARLVGLKSTFKSCFLNSSRASSTACCRPSHTADASMPGAQLIHGEELEELRPKDLRAGGLEQTQHQMTQKRMQRCEVGARSLRASSHAERLIYSGAVYHT